LGEEMRVRGACSSDAYTPPKAGSSRWLVHVDASSETCTYAREGLVWVLSESYACMHHARPCHGK